MVSYDDSGSIGKRYRRGDAIGTPYAISIDDETVDRDIITLRYRDSMEQTKMSITELRSFLEDKFWFK